MFCKYTENRCVGFNEVIWLVTVSQWYDINRPRPGHAHNYTKHAMCFSIMMVIGIKQYLSNISSSSFNLLKFTCK